jgi:hypothetical protein
MASSRPTDVGRATSCLPILSGVEVVREGRVEPFLHAHPTVTSSSVRWAGLAVEILDPSVRHTTTRTPRELPPRHSGWFG